jgi:hypothetical protein
MVGKTPELQDNSLDAVVVKWEMGLSISGGILESASPAILVSVTGTPEPAVLLGPAEPEVKSGCPATIDVA